MNKNQTQFLTGFLIAAVIFGAIGGGAYVITQTSLLDKFKKGNTELTDTASESEQASAETAASSPMFLKQHPHQAELDKLKEGYLYWDKSTDKYYMKDGSEFPHSEVVFLQDGTPITSGLNEKMQEEEDGDGAIAHQYPHGTKLKLVVDNEAPDFNYFSLRTPDNKIQLKWQCESTIQGIWGTSGPAFFLDANNQPAVFYYENGTNNLNMDEKSFKNPGSGELDDPILMAVKKVTNGKTIHLSVDGGQEVFVLPKVDRRQACF